MSPSLLGQIVFALAYCSIGAHLWARRKVVLEELAALPSWISARLAEFLQCLPRKPAVGEADCTEEEVWVKKQMEEIRIQFGRRMSQLCAKLCGSALIAMSFVWSRSADPIVAEQMPLIACAALATHVIVVNVALGRVRLTQFRLKLIYVLLNMIFLVRIWTAPAAMHFYVLHNARFVFRLLLGLLVLDRQCSWVMNSMWAAVQIRQLTRVQNQSFGQGAISDMLVVAVGEVFTTMVLQCMLWFTEYMVESNVRSNLGMIVARSVQRSVRRLLSVLCDAELHLTPGLKICEPSQKVAHLLAPDLGAAGRAAVEGCSFADFVAEADRGRFRSFLSSSGADGGSELGPAASIGLHLRDTTGTCVPVELFYAKLPYESGRQPDHLIGVRECGGATREASPCAEAQGPTHGPGPIPPRPPPLLPPEAAADAELAGAKDVDGEASARFIGPCAPPQLGGGSRAEGAGKAAPGVFAQEFDVSERVGVASSASSGHSRRSAGQRVKCLDLPVLSEITVHFDLMTEDLAVTELRCRFTGKSSEGPQKPPMLHDWVHDSMWAKLRKWVQTGFNAAALDEEVSPFGPLLLQWPSGGGAEELFLEASQMAIEVADEGGSTTSSGSECGKVAEHEDSEEKAPDQLSAVLKLRGFKQYTVRAGVPRAPHGRPSSRRSARSGRSQGRALEKLPSIDEDLHGDGTGGGQQGGVPSDV